MLQSPCAGKFLKSDFSPFPTAESCVIWEDLSPMKMISDFHPIPHPSVPYVCLLSSVSSVVSCHIHPHSCPCLAIGLMIRPKTENLDVIVNVSDTESWDQHVQKLNKFLERECGAGDVLAQDLGQGTGDPRSRTSGHALSPPP